ncbi:MAG: small, acid-soluble spore protein, alpha/beta type [Sulfobacillus sp.]
MARTSNTGNHAVVREAAKALDQFKYEVARDMGIQVPEDDYWGDISARECGAVGGHMVRKMIEMAEQTLAGRPTTRHSR